MLHPFGHRHQVYVGMHEEDYEGLAFGTRWSTVFHPNFWNPFICGLLLLSRWTLDKLVVTVSTNTRGFWSPNGQQLCLKMCVTEGYCLDAYPQSPNLATILFCPQERLQCWLYSTIFRYFLGS